MQVKGIAVNAAHMTAGWTMHAGGVNQVQDRENMFGAECKVTISQEGRELSRQQTGREEKSAQQAKAERMLHHQQEESRLNEDMKRSYREKLKELEDTADALNHTYHTKKDMETVEQEQDVRDAMRRQQQFQMEENERRAREARQMAGQSADYQKEMDENNRDLLTLLKTIEATEEAQDGQEKGRMETVSSESVRPHTGNALGSVSDAIQESALSFTVTSMGHVGVAEEAIADLSDQGHQLLDRAGAVIRGIFRESAGIRAALEDDGFTDEEIAGMMKDFQERMPYVTDSIEKDRSRGLQNLQDARECKIQHLGEDPLAGMAETKKSMMLSAVDAAYGEVVQDSLGEASRELKEQVEKLLDERNDIDGIRRDEEEEEAKQEEILDGLL